MKSFNYYLYTLLFLGMLSCNEHKDQLAVEVYETSANGNKLQRIREFSAAKEAVSIKLMPDEKFQTITGFGGSFTEASAYLLNQVSKENRDKVLEAYFGEDGARYSLTRTHMNSCDFSLSNYSYAAVEGDIALENFSIDEDRDDQRDDGLAGEIAFDLINNFSFSVLKILTTDIPARYGFRYRLDNNFVLRGSSDFQENGSRVLIEFESRF